MLLALLLAAAPVSHVVDCGPLQLRVVVAEAPQIFHIVDQASGWNAFTHRRYRQWFIEHGGISPEQERLLFAHVELRKRGGWGPLDAIFNIDATAEAALGAAEKSGALTKADADIERRLFGAFSARAQELISSRRPAVDRFAQAIDASAAELTGYAKLSARFWRSEHLDAPVFLVPAPSDEGGGGASGGLLVLEIGDDADPTYVLEHELWHAFARSHDADLHAAAKELKTDFETVSEGLAYAVAPGIFRPKSGDMLATIVGKDIVDGSSFANTARVRFNRLGLALRPTLEVALRGGGTFESYLPIEKAVYQALVEVNAAADRADPRPRCFWFGPTVPEWANAITAGKLDTWVRPLGQKFLVELRDKIREQDVMLIGLSGAEVLPPELSERLGTEAVVLAERRAKEKSGELRRGDARSTTVLVYFGALTTQP